VKIGLDLEGGEALRAALLTLSRAVRRRALYSVLRPAAEPMRLRMQRLAPHGATGELAAGITVSAAPRIGSVAGGQWQAADEFQAAVAVGPSKLAFYGIFQEYGTVEHPAQAFGRPAFDGSRDEALQILGEGLWQLLEDATNKTGRFEED